MKTNFDLRFYKISLAVLFFILFIVILCMAYYKNKVSIKSTSQAINQSTSTINISSELEKVSNDSKNIKTLKNEEAKKDWVKYSADTDFGRFEISLPKDFQLEDGKFDMRKGEEHFICLNNLDYGNYLILSLQNKATTEDEIKSWGVEVDNYEKINSNSWKVRTNTERTGMNAIVYIYTKNNATLAMIFSRDNSLPSNSFSTSEQEIINVFLKNN